MAEDSSFSSGDDVDFVGDETAGVHYIQESHWLRLIGSASYAVRVTKFMLS